MPGEINIPVKVIGAAEAKAQIAGVGDAARIAQQVAQARSEIGRSGRLDALSEISAGPTEETVRSYHRIRDAAGEATKHTEAFHIAGERAAANILARINPAFGEMAHTAAYSLRTVGSMSPALIELIAAGAGLGLLVNLFEGMAETSEKAREEIEKQAETVGKMREKGAEGRGTLADEAAKAGVYTDIGALQARSRGMQVHGVPEKVADSAAIAEQLAAGKGMDFDANQYLRGLTTRGMQPPDLAGRKGLQALKQILAAGGGPETEAALAAYLGGSGEAARAGAPGEGQLAASEPERLMAEIRRRHPGLSEAESLAVARLAQTGQATTPAGAMESGVIPEGTLDRILNFGGAPSPGAGRFNAGLGGKATIRELVDLANPLAGEQQQRALNGGSPAQTGSAPQGGGTVIINIHNVDTGHFEAPATRWRNEGVAAAELLTGVE